MNNPRSRNLGISAHIEAGRTTLTERILTITSQIHKRIEAEQTPEPIRPTVGDRIVAQRIENLLK